MEVITSETRHSQLSDQQFAVADQLVREATVTLMGALGDGLPEGQQVCTSSSLSILLQSVALLLAEFDRDATAKMLTMIGLSFGDGDTNMPAYQAAMQHQQQRLMIAEMSLRARYDVEGQA